MCGIHGFTWKDEAAAERMVAAAKHRGPDGSGVWSDHHVTLGHNLLAIAAEPAASVQPWHHAGCVLTYNGEIYNYSDLRKTLQHTFKTDSDTELLAAGLYERGAAFLRDIDGMFALAWYNPSIGTLLLARDSNGARPLYYGRHNGRLVFSSEIRSLLSLGMDRRVSKEAFRHYYYAGLVAGRLTMFEGIYKLLPGQVSEISLHSDKWDTFNLNDQAIPAYDGDPEAIPQLLREKLRDATAATVPARRRFGLFLSGGMDSSAILYSLCREIHNRPRTFSTRFTIPHDKCSHNGDADAAAWLAGLYKTKHREVLVNQQAWVDHFEPAVLAMEEPKQGKSYAAYHACNQLLKFHNVVVTLSGDGGDELLMGYKHQHTPSWHHRFSMLRAGHRVLPDPSLGISVDEQVAYQQAWVPAGGLTGDAINDFMYVECLSTLCEDFLVRNDKLGAAFGMEARFPMMCRGFRDFCRSIPGNLKAASYLSQKRWDVNNKSLLRQAYTDKLPVAVTFRGKTGWRAPTDEWIIGRVAHPAKEGPVREYIRAALTDPAVRELFQLSTDVIENRYLNNRQIVGPLKPDKRPTIGVGLASQKELFCVLMFAVWFKAFNMQLW